MKKNALSILSFVMLFYGSFAQNINQSQIKPCGTFDAMEHQFKLDPSQKISYELHQADLNSEFQKLLSNPNNSLQKNSMAIYTIPVVFHILHLNGSEKIDLAQVNDAVNILNKDFNKLNSDLSSVISSFIPIIGDAKISFKLAKKDPNGTCTNGVIYYETPSTNWNSGDLSLFAYSGTSAGKWNPTKYLNVYVVKTLNNGAAGYTYLPGSWPTGNPSDAIVILSRYVGSIGTGNPNTSRALTHEVGHWLNLKHTWGGTNNPLIACGDDGIPDTPITKGYTTCPTEATSKICNISISENYQNYMDYSFCCSMFTQNQSTAMQNAINSSISGRNNLWSTFNLIETGITPGYTCAPSANFETNKTTICAGSSITYSNLSEFGTTGSVDWNFEGGSPSASTLNAPVVTYNTPGIYSVSLTATNANGSNTKIKSLYVNVEDPWTGYVAPLTHDFESGAFPWRSNVTNLNAGSVRWEVNQFNGANGSSKSIYLSNASQNNTFGHIDIFDTPPYNFNNASALTLSFYYAYAKKFNNQADVFSLQLSVDCGATWQNVLASPNVNTMATNSGGVLSTPFNPTAAQWKQVVFPSALLAANSPNPNGKSNVKFRFYFQSDPALGSSNNLFIDQINVSGVVGLNELENSMDLSIYPNPTHSSSTINFNLYTNEKIKIKVIDILGRVIDETDKLILNENKTTYIFNKNEQFERGIYFVNIEINTQSITKKIIIH
ncbi:MAG: M43 family zinc metalloprotease [Bacteroidota bacterium]